MCSETSATVKTVSDEPSDMLNHVMMYFKHMYWHIFTYSTVNFFGVLSSISLDMANLSLNDNDGSSGASDQDTLAPLPLPGATPWPLMHTFPYQYPQPYPTQPPPYHELSSYSYAPGSAGSQHSEGESPVKDAIV